MAAPAEEHEDEAFLSEHAPASSHKYDLSDPSAFPQVASVSAAQSLQCVWIVMRGFFTDRRTRTRACSMAFVNLVMMMGFAALQMWYLTKFRDFQNALHEKKADVFYHNILVICVVSLLTMPVIGLRDGLRGSFALEWRRYLTERL